MINKLWKTPKLFVVVNGSPEEAVLSSCKTNSGEGTGPAIIACSFTSESGVTECLEPAYS